MFDASALEAITRNKKPKRLRVEQVYSKMFYNQKIKSAVECALLDSSSSDRKEKVAIRSRITKELYAEETSNIKAQVEAEREAIYAREMESYYGARDLNAQIAEGTKGCVRL